MTSIFLTACAKEGKNEITYTNKFECENRYKESAYTCK